MPPHRLRRARQAAAAAFGALTCYLCFIVWRDSLLVEGVRSDNAQLIVRALRLGASPNTMIEPAPLSFPSMIRHLIRYHNLGRISEPAVIAAVSLRRSVYDRARAAAMDSVIVKPRTADLYDRARVDALHALIDGGADPNATETDGCPLIVLVADVDEPGVAEYLIKHGADVNAHDRYGWTPLAMSCFIRNLAFVTELMRHKVDINAEDRREAASSARYELSLCREPCKESCQKLADILEE